MKRFYYASYMHYMVSLDTAEKRLLLTEQTHGASASLAFSGLFGDDGEVIASEAYTVSRVDTTLDRTCHSLKIILASDGAESPSPELTVSVDPRGITLHIGEIGHYSAVLEGSLSLSGDCRAVNTKDTPSDVLRSALGPATSKFDNALYDRLSDTALEINGCRGLTLGYDFAAKEYTCRISTKSEGVAEVIRFTVRKDILAERYAVEYKPMKLGRKYSSPPAGFMTWYSLKFETSEKRVLENAELQAKRLAPFGANTVWVDWEWCHRRYERERHDGVDSFNPDKEKYPRGLGYLAEEIKRLGQVPALWIGFTNDACLTDYEREHPEISLSHHDTWSGRYYYDITEPEYLNGFLPKAVGQVVDWGYEAIKFDTLPNCITAHELYHENMRHPERTTYAAYRDMISRVRELIGEDKYFLSCGSAEEVVLWGSGVFDAARVGPDLFTWEKYCETLGRIRRYYALHTNTVYCDPDCLVLREEYSTLPQARSRAVPISLLGLPLNFGDELVALPEERLELLKRSLPTLNAHPTDLGIPTSDGITQLAVLKVASETECYTVAALVNLTDKARERDISISDTLRLSDGKYIVFDYFRDRLVGIFDEGFTLCADPYDTTLISVRRLCGVPQVISSSRHFSQGAVEIKSSAFDEESLTLTTLVSLVAGDEYRLSVYVPEGYRALRAEGGRLEVAEGFVRLRVSPPETGEYPLKITFEKTL